MATQLSVRLSEGLSRRLRAASRRMQRKNSEIVRMALQEFLGTQGRGQARAAERVRNLIGSLDSGVPDLAARHRAYLLKSLRRGR